MKKKIYSVEELLQKPICVMSGEEFAFLINNVDVLVDKGQAKEQTPSPERKFAYGIRGIADTFGCSIPTANRIKKSGAINKAISQIGRKIIVDVNLALELVANNKEG